MDDEYLKKRLLRKFYLHNAWGKHHFREDTLIKGFPPHLKHRIKTIAEELRGKNLLIKFPTAHGMQWYANIEKIKEIEEIILSKD